MGYAKAAELNRYPGPSHVLLFAGRKADSDQVERLTREIAALQAQLRFVHLRAHLEMVAVLMPAQIDTYQRLRGYRDGHTGGHQHQH